MSHPCMALMHCRNVRGCSEATPRYPRRCYPAVLDGNLLCAVSTDCVQYTSSPPALLAFQASSASQPRPMRIPPPGSGSDR